MAAAEGKRYTDGPLAVSMWSDVSRREVGRTGTEVAPRQQQEWRI